MSPLNRHSWENSSFSTPPTPLVFTARSCETLSYMETWLALVWPRAGIACSQGIPPNFYPSHLNVAPPVLLHSCCLSSQHRVLSTAGSPSLLLRIWMNVASLNPRLSDFHIVWFSGSSGCFCFEVGCDSSCGCVRKWTVSDYISILTRSPLISLVFKNWMADWIHWEAECWDKKDMIFGVLPTALLQS